MTQFADTTGWDDSPNRTRSPGRVLFLLDAPANYITVADLLDDGGCCG